MTDFESIFGAPVEEVRREVDERVRELAQENQKDDEIINYDPEETTP